jgi:hypothetical protein
MRRRDRPSSVGFAHVISRARENGRPWRGDGVAGRQSACLPLQHAAAGAETLTIASDPASDAQKTMTTARRAFLNMARS